MFVSSNQLYYFLLSCSLSVALSPIFTVSSVVKSFIKNKIVRELPDFFAFVVFGVLFSYFSFVLRFPNIRPYILLAAVVGVFAYKKSFHHILAMGCKKLYNIMRKIVTEAKRKGREKCPKKKPKEE